MPSPRMPSPQHIFLHDGADVEMETLTRHAFLPFVQGKLWSLLLSRHSSIIRERRGKRIDCRRNAENGWGKTLWILGCHFIVSQFINNTFTLQTIDAWGNELWVLEWKWKFNDHSQFELSSVETINKIYSMKVLQGSLLSFLVGIRIRRILRSIL